MADERYVPAAGRAAFTRLYDPVMALTMREGVWRGRLVSDVLAGRPESVLDVGCGTGTLAVALAAAAPDIRVVGIDGDPDVLARARAKAGPGASIEWVEGLGDALPFPDAAFDRVVSSLVFHHLVPAVKRAVLAEALRVLRPGGRLHIADWGRPQDPLMRVMFAGLQLLDGIENTRDHAAGRLPDFIAGAGFGSVASGGRLRTTWGSLELLTATA